MAPHSRPPKLKFPKKVRETELVQQNQINGFISFHIQVTDYLFQI